MKKLLLLLLLSAVTGINAQTIYQENFNAAQSLADSGWTLFSMDADTGPANNWLRLESTPTEGLMASFSYYQIGLNPNNYAFSPAIVLPAGTAPLKLSYKHSSPDAAYDAEKYTLYVTTSPTVAAATAATQIHHQATMNNINSPTEITFDLSAYAGQTVYLCFRHHDVYDEFRLYIDDIKVEKLVPNNLSLNAVTVAPIIPGGNYSFVGQIKNQGTNAVTSYKVNWTANGGAVNSYDVTGVNIASGATHTFTHSVPLNAAVGQTYALNFNVPTVNGVADADLANNSLTRNTQVASGSTTFRTLIEKFTASTCGPCASYNNATFNPFYTAQNQNFNYIAYQQDFPGTGDPYYTAEAGARRAYYGINAITSLRIDGADYSTGNGQAAITNFVNAQNTRAGYFELNGTRNLSGNNAVVAYTIYPYLTGTFTLQVAVYEKLTTNNTGTNGETSFKHVMMKMVPNASGTPITFTAGTTVTGSVTASLAGTNIEELSDCDVMIFIQNPVTKEVMQSFRAVDLLSTSTNTLAETVKLYPNPGSDFVRISDIEKADVTVTDLLGKTVINLKDVTNQTDINVSALQNGVYLFSIKNETANKTLKFVKK